MIRSDGYDGSARAFEGETTLLVRSVPVGALLKRATLTVTPVAGPTGALFEERIDFAAPADPSRTLGATKLAAGTAFVEVDFHKRRTLAAVAGTNLNGTSLQVDLGGVYVEINSTGAILSPNGHPAFTVTDGHLPGLTVGKFKLTSAGVTAPDASTVTFRSVPSNLTVALAKMAPFWARPGELAAAATSPDFAAPLQAFLATATVENGFYLVPLVVHSDTLARLSFTLDVEYVDSVTATPNGLDEVHLPFGVGTVANAPVQLSVSLPPGARVVAGDTTARLTGAFGATRIVDGYGAPTGDVSIAGTATVTPTVAVAQVVAFAAPVSAVALDLLLTGLTRTAQLALDLRADLDGKPDGTSLLGATVPFTLQSTASPTPAWVSVTLPKEFHFAPTGAPTRYWIVLQSLDGLVSWNLAALAAPAGVTPPPLPAMQQTADGGLSWRTAVLDAPAPPPPLSALYRLRYQPDRYHVPIEMQIGSGAAATRVNLDRFEPLHRVDFTLDVPEVAAGFNHYLSQAVPASCSQAEHVANGDFRQWHALGTDLGAPHVLTGVASTGLVLLSPDGQYAYAGDANGPQLSVVDVLRDVIVPASITLPGVAQPVVGTASSDGSRIYVGTTSALHVVDAAARADLGAVTTNSFGSPRFGVVSPDGAYLYVGNVSGVQAFAVAAVDEAVGTHGTLNALGAPATTNPTAAAVSPDGMHLYVTTNDTLGGHVLVLGTPALDVETTAPVGQRLGGIAVTPDGLRLIVLDAQPPTVWIVDAASNTVVTSVPIASGTPQALAIAPDGARAYIVTEDPVAGQAIVVLDLARLVTVGQPASLAAKLTSTELPALVTIAATAAGTRLYVADGARRALTSVPIGKLIPADWTPSGVVQLAPQRSAAPVLMLGDWRSRTKSDVSMSQVVPVADRCSYLFTFSAGASSAADKIEGLHAGAPEAAAEVIWLDGQCGVARTDTVPIGKPRPRALTPYRAPLQAPAGVTQAEIRFRATAGTFVELSSVSLAGNADAVANGDLSQLGADGAPTGWSTNSAAAGGGVGVSALAAGGMRVRNAGAQPAELTQAVDVVPNAHLFMEFVGRAVNATANPTIELGFGAADGTPVGTPTRIAVDPYDFDRHLADVAPPAGAAKATVSVRVPPSTALDVQQLALRWVDSVTVPVSFIAQAPGDLRVSRAVVAYERVPLPPPPVPQSGLCTPTPAGVAPGETADDGDSCYCTACDATRKLQHATATTTPAGRPAIVATCATCGTPVLRIGGPVVTAPAYQAPLLPAIVLAAPDASAVLGAESAQATASVLIVPGIGPARAAKLAAAGIKTVGDLARANPNDVVGMLRGVSPANVAVIFASARRLYAAALSTG